MYKVVTFLYVWKKSNEFELSNSIKLLRKNYPDCKIALVGDVTKCNVDQYIPYIQKGDNRATRVTGAILHAATLLDSFVLMYDDIFLNNGFDFSNAYHRGQLKPDNKVGNYNKNIVNSLKFLEYHNKPTYNFECHQPYLFDSNKLISLFKLINTEHHHLIKSIYCNYYGYEDGFKPNLKTNNIREAKKYYQNHRCFSSTDDITTDMQKFIVSLTAEYLEPLAV